MRPLEVRINSLGINVNPVTSSELIRFIDTNPDKPSLILNHNLHSAYMFQVDPLFRELYAKATITVIDGKPIHWLAQFSSRRKLPGARIGSTDWLEALCAESSADHCVLVVGGSARVNTKAVQSLRERSIHSIHGLAGYEADGYSLANLERLLVELEPTLVLIGLGMPMQERLLLDLHARLLPGWYATVGGAIDFLSGEKQLAPRWLSRLGLEWLWRLVHEPRRLAHRYLVEPMLLLRLVARR